MDPEPMDIDPIDLPGGSNFHDVTALLAKAAGDMKPGDLILADGFSLQDAMGAFEIGEPRFDSGMVSEININPPFNPLSPMLPEEICWLMDRSFVCEMEWHAGYTLSQTVFTVLFVHHLRDIDPDFLARDFAWDGKPSQPLELITVVLRSFIFGLLKCCDLAWRELSKERVHDAEDWQSEKCDVSLLEGVPVNHVFQKLEEASRWLQTSPKAKSSWVKPLLVRIHLRMALLQLMDSNLSHEYAKLPLLVADIRNQIQAIDNSPKPRPEAGSVAHRALDPNVARRLNFYIPLQILQLPPENQAWANLQASLSGMAEISILSNTASVGTWEIVGLLRGWCPPLYRSLPLLRSAIQSAFFDGVLVMNKYPLNHIVNRFFVETLDLTYDSYARAVKQRWTGSDPPPLSNIERNLVTGHVKAMWFNPPRRRRYLIKSLIDWHELYAESSYISSELAPVLGLDMVSRAQNVALLYRLTVIREIVFSGFQMSLYTSEEKAFAYWHAAHIIELHLNTLDELEPGISSTSRTHHELKFNSAFLSALQLMSTAMFLVTSQKMTISWERMRLNFLRRYKWAFISEYDDVDVPVVGHPQFPEFMHYCTDVQKDGMDSPAACFELAIHILSSLLSSPTGWAGKWSGDRLQFIRDLIHVCEGLVTLPSTLEEISTFDFKTLVWNPDANPWFPYIQKAT
ncbi:hypothetical protein SERLA73DRAFT_76363 [Serpula lacrymans var. lacrymans S7.3]|uniref:Mak10-domain-containing protein n=1 Tax=Serpula lacrymans var. lacrymans (strain S7.3) TaxID=936435 RepID=F8Q5D4_SERL3|nr:hypothetical protein SERLA73DRAFT_76363 [Serpula lacrymans var. lacrymans S7.3]